MFFSLWSPLQFVQHVFNKGAYRDMIFYCLFFIIRTSISQSTVSKSEILVVYYLSKLVKFVLFIFLCYQLSLVIISSFVVNLFIFPFECDYA